MADEPKPPLSERISTAVKELEERHAALRSNLEHKEGLLKDAERDYQRMEVAHFDTLADLRRDIEQLIEDVERGVWTVHDALKEAGEIFSRYQH